MQSSLKDWEYKSFVPCYDAGEVFYGSSQSWLSKEGVSNFYINRSCAVACAANALAYMASHIPGLSGLYPKASLSVQEFSEFEKRLFLAIRPRAAGVPTLSRYIAGVKSFALSCMSPLSEKSLANPRGYNEASEFISSGLSRERPVSMLTWNTGQKELRMHWVCVSRLDGEKIFVSNWSKLREYSLKDWIGSKSFYKGLVYFE